MLVLYDKVVFCAGRSCYGAASGVYHGHCLELPGYGGKKGAGVPRHSKIQDVRGKHLHQVFNIGIRFLVIDVHPDAGAVSFSYLKIPGKEDGFFKGNFCEIFSLTQRSGCFRVRPAFFWRVSDAVPKSSSMMKVPNWTPCGAETSRSGLRMTNSLRVVA